MDLRKLILFTWYLLLNLIGAGMSEGEFVSLGFYERDDLQSVTDYLMDRYPTFYFHEIPLSLSYLKC
jgi:hypothetical protein